MDEFNSIQPTLVYERATIGKTNRTCICGINRSRTAFDVVRSQRQNRDVSLSLPSYFSFQAPMRSIPAPQNIAGSAKNANFRRTTQSRCAYACESARGGIDLFARAMARSMQIIASFTEPPAIPDRR